jgi:hypothetical protein
MVQIREIRAMAVGCAILATYFIAVLATGRIPMESFAELLWFYVRASFSLWAAVGVGCSILLLYRHRPVNGAGPSPVAVLGDYVKERWERDRFASWLWPPLLFSFLLAAFNAFKQKVLPLAGYSFDPLLYRIDHTLFLGSDPWRVTHSVLASPTATLVIDRLYHGWFAPMVLGLVICAWMPASRYRLRTQYCLTYMGVWIVIGSIMAFAMPAAGPCFYADLIDPSSPYAPLMARLHAQQLATGTHFQALLDQHMLLQVRDFPTLVIGGGISAMPSVHNALAVLFVLGAFQLNRVVGWLFAAYAVVIWMGSIHLGWHYALDGPVATASTLLLWKSAGRLADWLDRPAALVPELAPA